MTSHTESLLSTVYCLLSSPLGYDEITVQCERGETHLAKHIFPKNVIWVKLEISHWHTGTLAWPQALTFL